MYLFSIKTGGKFECSGETWERALSIAEETGWAPEGTILDLAFQLFIHPEPNYLYQSDLFVLLYLHNYCLEWTGDYRSPEYQMVRDSDCEKLLAALEGTEADPKLLEFLALGNFRICPSE